MKNIDIEVGDRDQFSEYSEKTPLAFVLDRLRSAHNVGNIFRIAELNRISEVITCGYTATPPHPKLAKTSRDCDKIVPCRHYDKTIDAIKDLKAAGRRVVAVETVKDAKFPWDLEFKNGDAFVFGNEALGIDPEVLELCDEFVKLPVLGFKNSFNVGNCAAVIGYEAVKQFGIEEPVITVEADIEEVEPIPVVENPIAKSETIMKDVFLVNVGNTNVQFAKTNNATNEIELICSVTTKNMLKFHPLPKVVKDLDDMDIWVASVVPEISDWFMTKFPQRTNLITAKEAGELVDLNSVDASTIGADRLANAVAASQFTGDKVIIDCGTCITTEIVDANNALRGGTIMPGRELQHQALENFTGQLPNVELATTKNSYGTTTATAIQSLDSVAALGIKGVIAELQQEFPQLQVFFTGGDAEWFAQFVDDSTTLPHNFTLQGIQAITKANVN